MSHDAKTAAAQPAPEPTPVVAPVAAEGAAAAPAPDYYAQMLRVMADFANYRDRVEREKGDWIKRGRAQSLAKILPLCDLIERARQEVRTNHSDTPLGHGLEAVFKEFDRLFKEEGVVRIDPVGQAFDPHLHEAFGFVDKPGLEEGAVAETLEPGYKLGDAVLRTAKVRLQKGAGTKN